MSARCRAPHDPPEPVAMLHMLPTGGAADPMTLGRFNSWWGHLWRPASLLQASRLGLHCFAFKVFLVLNQIVVNAMST